MIENIDKTKLYATGLIKPKTTALFFEKIYLPEDYVRFANLYQLDNYEEIWNVPQEVILDVEKYCKGIMYDCFKNNVNRTLYYHAKENMENIISVLEGNKEAIRRCQTFYRNMGIKSVTNQLKEVGINIVPIFLEPTQFDFEYNFSEIITNTTPLAIICLDCIPSIIEEKLEWKQVLDIRKDKKSLNQLRKFINWCNIDLFDKSKEQIVSICEESIDSYKNTLRKHGILAVAGGVSIALSISETLLSNLFSNWNLKIGSVLSIASGLSVFAMNHYLEFRETQREPIAYIYNIVNKVDKSIIN